MDWCFYKPNINKIYKYCRPVNSRTYATNEYEKFDNLKARTKKSPADVLWKKVTDL